MKDSIRRNKESIKKILSPIGKSLGILGLLFVFYKLSQEYTLDSFLQRVSGTVSILPSLLLLNLLSVLVGIYVWHLMLRNYAAKPFPYLLSYYYFAKTEISKYLPGNIFHFVGRQLLASSLEISQIEMAKISLLFSIFLMIGTTLSSTLFALFSGELPHSILFLMITSSLAAIAVILLLYPSFKKEQKISLVLLSTLSVALQGVLLGMIVASQLDHMEISLFLETAGIYIVSWLIGFITPGASGGLGVREGTFIMIASFLHIEISSEIVVFSVLLLRLVNIGVDITLFLSTFLLSPSRKSQKNTLN